MYLAMKAGAAGAAGTGVPCSATRHKNAFLTSRKRKKLKNQRKAKHKSKQFHPATKSCIDQRVVVNRRRARLKDRLRAAMELPVSSVYIWCCLRNPIACERLQCRKIKKNYPIKSCLLLIKTFKHGQGQGSLKYTENKIQNQIRCEYLGRKTVIITVNITCHLCCPNILSAWSSVNFRL